MCALERPHGGTDGFGKRLRCCFLASATREPAMRNGCENHCGCTAWHRRRASPRGGAVRRAPSPLALRRKVEQPHRHPLRATARCLAPPRGRAGFIPARPFPALLKLTMFRVQNYKKINDTGWVGVGQMTAFVGKNEAGKSAVFRGLSKLNPSDGAKYDGLKEFPRRRYANEFKQCNWPVSSAVFELSKDDVDGLATISGAFAKTTHVVATRYYDDTLEIEYVRSREPMPARRLQHRDDTLGNWYEPTAQRHGLAWADLEPMLVSWQTTVSGLVHPEHGEDLAAFKDALLKAISGARAAMQNGNQVTRDDLQALQSQMGEAINAPWQKELVADIATNIGQLVSKFDVNQDLEKASQFVREYLPRFIYFDRYDVLDSAVNINEFIGKLDSYPDDPKIRITNCLFKHVQLDIKKIRELDPSGAEKDDTKSRAMVDERTILMDSAAAAMTENFSKWWEQRKHKFEYKIDGPHFRVWVSDDLDPSRIELDERSAGLQYFFSFFLVFLTESDGRHTNSILLLDEPGLQFHGTAQQKTVEFLQKLSADNQLLYTTHSPFMVDADRLEDVRVVTEGRDDFGSTRVSNDMWPRDPDALFPLQAGLGYKIAQTLFYSNRQVVVEGLTDYMYLKAAGGFLARHSRRHLDRSIAVSPMGGTSNMMRLASLLAANDVRMATVLDGDTAGLQASKKLKELAPDIVIVDEFTGKKGSEIEDMFDEPFFMDAVKKAYPNIELDFNADEEKITSVAQKASELFRRKGENFNKHTVCTTILNMLDKNNTSVPSGAALEKFEKLFERLNSLCGPPTERGSGSPADPQ